MNVSENLPCLFTADITRRDRSFVIEIPQHELDTGEIRVGDAYRVAMLSAQTQENPSTKSASAQRLHDEPDEPDGPPVAEGDLVDVEIEDIGDEGDGIARVGDGYVIIVSDADLGERVAAEITVARETVAFADVGDRP